ncbi:MAG TPA: hypothetical protein DHW71_11025, partial [Gammaproteobacteria bacterium]|nr:hypothetical protein [Gammaproteobacteria bacterium]
MPRKNRQQTRLNGSAISSILIMLTSLLLLSANVLAQTWDAGGDGINVSDPNNWDNDFVPGTSETANFDGTSTTNAAWNSQAPATVNQITIQDSYTGTVYIDKDITVSSSVTLNNTQGTLALSEQLTTPLVNFAAGARLRINVESTVTTNNGLLNIVNGTPAPQGTLIISESIDETSLTLPYTIKIINWPNTPSSNFDDIELPILQDGYNWDLSKLYTTGEIAIIATPGGLTFSPILWLNANYDASVIRNESNAVEKWIDITGHNNSAYSPQTSQAPLFVENAFTTDYGSFNTVRTDGENDYLEGTISNLDNFTIVMIAKVIDRKGNNRGLITLHDNGSEPDWNCPQCMGVTTYNAPGRMSVIRKNNGEEWSELSDDYHINTIVMDNKQLSFYQNTRSGTSKTWNNWSTLQSNHYLLSRRYRETNYSNMDFVEVIVFDRALNSDELFSFITEMNNRYKVYPEATWTSDGTTDISTASYWTNNEVPSSNSALMFSGYSINNAEWNADDTDTVDVLTIEDSYTGTLSINRDLTVTNEVTLNNTVGSVVLSETLTAGTVNFGEDARLQINLQSISEAENGKLVETAGTSIPNGHLTITLHPSIDQSTLPNFDIFDWYGTPATQFKSVELPDLDTGYAWDLSQLYTTGEIAIIQAPGYIYGLSPKIWLDTSDSGTLSLNNTSYVESWLDKSGQNHHLFQESAERQPLLVADALNGYPIIKTDANNDYLTGEMDAANDITLFLVMKINSHSNYAGIFSLHTLETGDNTADWNSPNGFALTTANNVNGLNYVHDKFNIADSTDYTYQIRTVRINAGVVTGFHNLVKTTASSNVTFPSYDTINSTQFTIGARYTPGNYADINYAEIMYFNTALTDAQITALQTTLAQKYGMSNLLTINQNLIAHYSFDEASGTVANDTSGNDFDATLTNMSGSEWAEGIVGNAVYLDGTNDYIDVPDGFGDFTNGLTISSWINLDAYNSWSRLFDFGLGEASNNILLAVQNTNGDLYFGKTGNTDQYVISTNSVSLNQWHHIAATITNTDQFTFYIDGKESGTGTIGNIPNISRTENFIGKSNWSSDPYFDGKIDEFKIYNRALTQSEIYNLLQLDNVYFWDNQANEGNPRTAINWLGDIVPNSASTVILDYSAKDINWNITNRLTALDIRNTYTGILQLNDKMTLSKDLSLQSESKLRFNLDSIIPSAYGAIQARTLNLNGTLTITIDAGITQYAGLSFDILDWTNPLTTQFTAIELPELDAGLAWNLTRLYIDGTIQIISTPANDSDNITLWLESNDRGSLYVDDNNKVRNWVNKIGGKKSFFSSPVQLEAPAYQLNQINNMPVVSFDGVDEFLNTTSGPYTDFFSANEHSMFFVLKDESQAEEMVMNWKVGDANTNRVNLTVGETELTYHAVDSSSSSTVSGIYSNRYFIVGVVKTPTEQKIYVDGSLVSSVPNTASLSSGSDRFILGKHKYNSLHWNGQIAEVIFMKTGADTDEVNDITDYFISKYDIDPLDIGKEAHYTFDETSGTTAADATDNNFDVTLNNATNEAWSPAIFNNGLTFDGFDDYITGDALTAFSPTDFSVSAWIKTSATDTSGGEIINIEEDIVFRVQPDGKLVGFHRTSGGLNNIVGNANVLDNQWHHIVFTQDSSTTTNNTKIYVDGVLDSTASTAAHVDQNLNAPNITIGSFAFDFNYNGSMDDLRLYSRTLTADEVAMMYRRANFVQWDNDAANGLSNTALNWSHDATPSLEDSLIIGTSAQ